MRAYELMVIFKVDTDESSIQTFMNRLDQMANEANGSLEKLDKWGVRRFSHEIRKAREGFYVVAEFVAPNALTELDRVMRLAVACKVHPESPPYLRPNRDASLTILTAF